MAGLFIFGTILIAALAGWLTQLIFKPQQAKLPAPFWIGVTAIVLFTVLMAIAVAVLSNTILFER